RGSAAGSLVSYAIGITDVDPVEYDITFERFLNPERVSMPDIDLDFEDARRDEVIRWVTEKYGSEHVAQIVTFGTLGAKAAIRDAARVMGYQPFEADKLCKAIPGGPGWTLARAMKESSEFRQIVAGESRARKLVETAQNVEGLSRHCGVHAAGIVISKEPLSEHIPLYRSGEGLPITGYEMGILEKIGLLKMDFLGLSNLTVLAKAVENIESSHADLSDEERSAHPILNGGVPAIPFDDPKTYEMLARGETVGVFQLESAGMRRNIMELKPQSVRELAAMVALYRPGPMEHIPRYVDYKFGRKQPEVLHDRVTPILEETYGVIVYQDQVLKVVQALAGFSLGKADVLRRAMGKKNLDDMERMQGEFMDGCEANGVDRKIATKVWNLLLPFAGYAFNKAHSVCYAIIACQTAYLKANYPVEYMAALLAVYRTKEDRVTTFIEECKRQKIAVLQPDVAMSHAGFTIERSDGDKAVRFGMGAIKNVGEGLVRRIIEARKDGPFQHLYDFCARTREGGLNRLALESLIKAGALDSVEPNRNKLLNNVESAITYADRDVRARKVGQEALFGDSEPATALEFPQLPDQPMPERGQVLSWEKAVMGIYVSDHPLRGYERTLAAESSHPCSAVRELQEGARVTLAGVISSMREITTRRGDKMATMVVEDFSGQASCLVFPQKFAVLHSKIEKDTVVTVKGSVKHRQRPGSPELEIEVAVDDVQKITAPMAFSDPDGTVAGSLRLRVLRATRAELAGLKALIAENSGDYEVVLQFGDDPSAQPMILLERVAASDDLVRRIKQVLSRCEADLVHNGQRPQTKEPAVAGAR
ncbi:MAG: DNA polymerase III subunit alpha, partial [Armatimonadetes bacterium]|nr:DNA polymerase III subunit alpha [Armatimonadota bacterium]